MTLKVTRGFDLGSLEALEWWIVDDVVGAVSDAAKSVWDKTGDLVDEIGDAFEKVLDQMGDVLGALGQAILDPRKFIDVVKELIELLLCTTTDTEIGRRLVQGGAVAAGAPPQASKVAIGLARILCFMMRIPGGTDPAIVLISLVLLVIPVFQGLYSMM